MFGRKPKWNLDRLKTCLTEAEGAILKGRGPSADSIAALRELSSVPDTLLARAHEESGRVAGHVMLALLRRGKIHWNQVDALLAATEGGKDASLSRDMLAYLQTANQIAERMVSRGLHKVNAPDIAGSADDLKALIEAAMQRHPEARSLNILLGGVVSLTDREAARDLFRRATRGGRNAMATSIFDEGAHTYMNRVEVEAGSDRIVIDGLPAAIRAALNDRPAAYAAPEVELLFSVDVGFLEIYGPNWFSLAPYLMGEGQGLVMGVIGEPDRVAAVIAESREMIVRLARFHRLPDPEGYARAFAFVPITPPAGVGELKTLYACSRYLMAAPLLEASGRPVLLLDADYSVRDPIQPYIKVLKSGRVGVSPSVGLGALWPWRRHMAGIGWFTPTEDARRFLGHVSDYVGAGLALSPSWTLDQNALTYAVEMTHDVELLNVRLAENPFAQDRIRTVFEKAWRARIVT